ncbi:MAG: hypothetical protein QOE76_456, partial [Frankiales bacterium]|nr:hypothetical protein [Frankiales bacterium]
MIESGCHIYTSIFEEADPDAAEAVALLVPRSAEGRLAAVSSSSRAHRPSGGGNVEREAARKPLFRRVGRLGIEPRT